MRSSTCGGIQLEIEQVSISQAGQEVALALKLSKQQAPGNDLHARPADLHHSQHSCILG